MAAAVLDRPEVVSGRFEPSMPEEEYHAHPALSASGMKVLLRSPKHFRLARTENRAPRTEFDVGHAAHALVLGVGMPIVEFPAHLLSGKNMAIQSNAAKAWEQKARDEQKVPLKPAAFQAVKRMSEAVLANPKARRLLEPAGWSEVSLFAQDPATGVQERGRIDRLGPHLVDFKTAADISDRKVTTAIVELGYDISAAVYRSLVQLVLGYDPGPMHLIFVEKDPPYDVRVVVLDGGWEITGEAQMRAALDEFARCSERGEWPGRDEEDGPIRSLPVPSWHLARFADDETAYPECEEF